MARMTRIPGLVHADALCRVAECNWHVIAPNATGLAAQHTNKTGHEVSISVEYNYIMRPGKPKGTR